MQKTARSSKLNGLLSSITNHNTVIESWKRIQRLVEDNKAARLPNIVHDHSKNVWRVEEHETYMEMRGLVLNGMTVAQIR
jgi:hypothetical protein